MCQNERKLVHFSTLVFAYIENSFYTFLFFLLSIEILGNTNTTHDFSSNNITIVSYRIISFLNVPAAIQPVS